MRVSEGHHLSRVDSHIEVQPQVFVFEFVLGLFEQSLVTAMVEAQLLWKDRTHKRPQRYGSDVLLHVAANIEA